MRILAGYLGGREISRPANGSVRPMTEKLRGALFNIIGNGDGQLVLDVYAGSGVIGLEALSRGAAQVVLLEGDRRVAATIRQTITQLGVDAQAQVITRPVEQWLLADHPTIFDLIVADPPYAQLNPTVLSQLGRRLAETGIMVVSYSSRLETPKLDGLKLVSDRRYGDASLAFYRH